MNVSKMRVMLAVLAMSCGAVGVASAQEAVAPSFVFVDLDSVFTNYNKTKTAEAQLKEQADEIKSERSAMIQQFEKVEGDYKALRAQAQNTALSEDARNMKRAEAEDKLIEVRDMENKIRRLEESAQRKIEEQSHQ